MTYDTELEKSLQFVETLEYNINTALRAILKPIYDQYSEQLNIFKEIAEDDYESNFEVNYYFTLQNNMPQIVYSRSESQASFCMCADILPMEDIAQMITDELIEYTVIPDNIKTILDLYYYCVSSRDNKSLIYDKYASFITNNYIEVKDKCGDILHLWQLPFEYDKNSPSYLVFDPYNQYYWFTFNPITLTMMSKCFYRTHLACIHDCLEYCGI
jgi:hypothetical protein